MKLLHCRQCRCLFALTYQLHTCDCGHVSGKYVSDEQAVVNGQGVSVAIGNGSLEDAIQAVARSTGVEERKTYQAIGNIDYAWVRPHTGPGNPHTTVDPNIK